VDVSDRILILSSLITRDIRRVSLVVLLLRSTTRLFFITHSHTHKIQNAFLILWQIFSNSFVLHDRQKPFRQAPCDILPDRKRLGRPQQQFLCRYCIYISWFRSGTDSVMMRRNYPSGRDWNACSTFQQQFLLRFHFHKSFVHFPWFWTGILITKRFRVGQLKDGRIWPLSC